MQKKLMAIAVAGVLAAPVAMAQSTVVLSGYLDVAVENQKVDGGSGAGVQGVSRTGLNSNASWVRFSGTEDLGAGLKAVFQVESGVNMEGRTGVGSNGTTSFGGRSTFVGLTGGFGQVLIGSYSMPLGDLSNAIIDSNGRTQHLGNLLVNGQTTGNTANPQAAGPVSATNPTGTLATNCVGGQICASASATTWWRRSPSLQYISPNFAGFTGRFGWELPENKNGVPGTNGVVYKPQVFSASGAYANGPLMVGGAYEEHQDARANNGLGFDKGGLKDKAYVVGASYNLGVVKLGAAYSWIRYGNSTVSIAGDDDERTWAVNANIPVGMGKIEAGYAQKKVQDNDGRSANDSKQWTVGYRHFLSKRTELYVDYSKITNQANSARVFWVNGLSGNNATGSSAGLSPGQSPELISVGIAHAF